MQTITASAREAHNLGSTKKRKKNKKKKNMRVDRRPTVPVLNVGRTLATSERRAGSVFRV